MDVASKSKFGSRESERPLTGVEENEGGYAGYVVLGAMLGRAAGRQRYVGEY